MQAALAALRRVLTQDLEPDPTTGQRRIRRGVAADRMPSLGDPAMRHGRKTRTRPFTGYKRHVIKLVDADVIVGAIVRPANEPEHAALALLTPDLAPARTARRIADRSRLLGQCRHWRPPRARRRHSRQSVDEHQPRPISEVRVCDPARRGPRHLSRAADRAHRPPAPRPCSSPPPSAIPVRCARPARPPAADAPIAIHSQEALLQSLRAHQQQPEGRTQSPSADHHRTLARPRGSHSRTEGPLQRDPQEHPRCPTRRRRGESPTNCPTPQGRVNLRAQLSRHRSGLALSIHPRSSSGRGEIVFVEIDQTGDVLHELRG